MKLFSRNEEPIRFNVIDIENDERIILEKLIKASGGEITDDEESIVKFTSKKAFGKNKYPRAKIYDTNFIVQCVLQGKIIEAEKFRLSPGIPGDQYHMEHLLFGGCTYKYNVDEQKSNSPNDSSTSTQIATDGQSQETDDTMFTAREQSSVGVGEPVDESQMVVTPADVNICTPTLAGGDAQASTESREKRPCNLEYELIVKPKMAALEREAKRLVAAKESNGENRQLQRSLRTRTKRNLVAQTEASQERNLSDSENMDVENVRVNEESLQIISDSCGSPEKMLPIEILSTPEKAISSKPQTPEKSDSAWIETKRKVAPTVLSNVMLPLNRSKKVAKSLIATDSSKLLNVCYKGLKPATVQNAGEPVLSKTVKRKASHEKSSDEASTSKRNGKNERRGLFNCEKNANKSNEKKGESDSSEDEDNARKKKTKRRTTHSNEDSRGRKKPKDQEQESSDDEEGENSDETTLKEPSPKPGDSEGKKKTKRKLFNVDKERSLFDISVNNSSKSPRKEVRPDDSSDFSLAFSSDEEIPKKKRFRRKKVDSTDRITISDDSAEEDNPRRQRNIDLDKPGPSGVRKIDKDFYIDDDESSDDDSNERTNHHDRLEKAGDWKPIIVPKDEPLSMDGRSRGQVWRSRLTDKPRERNIHIRRGPFNATERNIMVNYLIKSNCIHKGKGLIVWKSMIDDGYLEHRTPQSLHNHFIKVILPNIEECTHLKEKDKVKFLLLRAEKSDRFKK